MPRLINGVDYCTSILGVCNGPYLFHVVDHATVKQMSYITGFPYLFRVVDHAMGVDYRTSCSDHAIEDEQRRKTTPSTVMGEDDASSLTLPHLHPP